MLTGIHKYIIYLPGSRINLYITRASLRTGYTHVGVPSCLARHYVLARPTLGGLSSFHLSTGLLVNILPVITNQTQQTRVQNTDMHECMLKVFYTPVRYAMTDILGTDWIPAKEQVRCSFQGYHLYEVVDYTWSHFPLTGNNSNLASSSSRFNSRSFLPSFQILTSCKVIS